MASQTQEIVQVAKKTTENTPATMENDSLTQRRHWQELIAATEIASAQLKEDNPQDAKVSGNASTGNEEDPGKMKKKRSTKGSIIPRIQAQASGSTVESVSTTSRTSKKRKASAVIVRDKEKEAKVLETSDAMTRKKQDKTIAHIEGQELSSSNNQKRHKLEDTIASSPDSLAKSELTPSQSDEQEDKNEVEIAVNPFNDTTIRQRKQAADKPKAAPVERPRRSIRPVVPYGSEVTEQKVRNKKPIEISQGSGIPLSQIPHVLRAIDKMKTSDDVLKGLHKLIYGRMGSKHDIKNHIRAFSGFKIQTPLDEIVLKEKLEKWKIAGLKDICHLFSLKSSGDKQKIVDRIYDFLKNPRDMTAPNEENGKSKSGKRKKSAAVKAKTDVVRKKTARDMFNAEQRPIYKEKAENDSKTLNSLLAEVWKGLTEDDKKSYAKKAAEANRNESQPKRQNLNKNKAKQPEMVEDSDLSDEEAIVMHEEEQKEDVDVMDLNSDFSDLPGDNEDSESDDVKEDNTMEVNS